MGTRSSRAKSVARRRLACTMLTPVALVAALLATAPPPKAGQPASPPRSTTPATPATPAELPAAGPIRKAESSRPQPAAPGSQPLAPGPEWTDPINIDFRGGTVREYVAALRAASTSANIVVNPEVGEVKLPPITLRSIPLPTALAVLDKQILDGQRLAVTTVGPNTGYGFGAPAWVIRSSAPDSGSSERTTWVRSISKATRDGGPTASQVLGAIEAATAAAGTSTPPASIAFHEGTNLVIISGAPQAISAATQVIEALESASHDPVLDRVTARYASQLEEARMAATKAQADSETRLRVLQEMLRMSEERAGALQTELGQREVQGRGDRAALDQARDDTQRLAAEVAELRRQLSDAKRVIQQIHSRNAEGASQQP